MEIVGTGVAIRPATDEEVLDYRRERAREDEPWREPVPLGDERLVVAQSFIEFRRDGEVQRWHGWTMTAWITTSTNATSELLELAENARDGIADLLGDLGIAGMKVTRLEFYCAPSRIEVDRALTSGGMFE